MNKLSAQLKYSLMAILLTAGVAIGYHFGSKVREPPSTRTVFVDKVVYRDRVISKSAVRTEVRPDGTKIVTETKEDSKEHSSESIKSKQSYTSWLPKYSVEALASQPLSLKPQLEYSLLASYRIGQSPIHVVGGMSADADFHNKRLIVGVRGELP